MKRADLKGCRFGELMVIDQAEYGGKHVQWNCRCDCGNLTIASTSNLRRGHTKTCGCSWYRDRVPRKKKSHDLYEVWKNMRARCSNPKNLGWKYYGGKGVTVCARWSDFWAFVDDMGQRPSTEHQIDREDSDGNYEPSNCRWLTAGENTRRRDCVKLTDETAVQIHKRIAAGEDLTEISLCFGVTVHCIADIQRNRTWQHVINLQQPNGLRPGVK